MPKQPSLGNQLRLVIQAAWARVEQAYRELDPSIASLQLEHPPDAVISMESANSPERAVLRSRAYIRYDAVSRSLHWLMALLFSIVFAAAITRYLALDSELDADLWPLHKPLGALLLVLGIARCAWAIHQRSNRPPALNAAARWGHRFLYALMLIVPVLALGRQYGSGRAFEPFGLQLFAERSSKIEWAVSAGNTFHAWLGWFLLAAVVGHIAMAVWHRARGHSTGRM